MNTTAVGSLSAKHRGCYHLSGLNADFMLVKAGKLKGHVLCRFIMRLRTCSTNRCSKGECKGRKVQRLRCVLLCACIVTETTWHLEISRDIGCNKQIHGRNRLLQPLEQAALSGRLRLKKGSMGGRRPWPHCAPLRPSAIESGEAGSCTNFPAKISPV